MSENRDGAGAGDEPVVPATNENSEMAAPPAAGTKQEKSPFERRLFIFKAAFFLSGVAALGYTYYRQRRIREMTDNDPYDPRGGGRGRRTSPNSDNDPTDPEGGGKGQGRIVIQPKPDIEPKNQGQPGSSQPDPSQPDPSQPSPSQPSPRQPSPSPDAAPKSETPPGQPKPDSNP